MQRDLQLDGLKFIMIFLVVLGHLINNDLGLEAEDWGLKSEAMIYAFHMPVFVFLSGYFTTITASRAKQLAWLKQTLSIYLLAQVAYIVLREVLGMPSFLRKGLIIPGYGLWYLVCLMYWRLAVWWVFKGMNDIWLLVLSGVMAFVSGFIPVDRVFSFQRAFAFFPFFALGVVFRKRGWMAKLIQVPYVSAWVVLISGLLIARYFPTYRARTHYLDGMDVVLRNMQGVLGLVLCLSIVKLSRIRLVGRLAPLGQYTLWIYIGHIYLIILGSQFFPLWGVRLNLVSAFLLACVYCVFLVGIARLCKRMKRQTPMGGGKEAAGAESV